MNDPAYTLLTSETEYRQACDTLLRRAQHQILIFDSDLGSLRLEEEARAKALDDFLRTDASRRIRMVLHEPERLERSMPRLMRLIERFAHAIEVRQSPDNLRHLADTHLLVDSDCGLRRFHVNQPRGALVLDDPGYIQPWWQRFETLWELSDAVARINPGIGRLGS